MADKTITDDVPNWVNTGGPAFPQTNALPSYYGEGMNLRDWFAGQAMGNMLDGSSWPQDEEAPEIARRSFLLADAMLAEREKKS